MPALREVVLDICEAGPAELLGECLGRRQEAKRGRQVAIGGAVRQQAADCGDDPPEVETVTPAEHPPGGLGDLQESDPPTWTDDPAQFGVEDSRVAQVAQREAADGAVDAAVGERQTQHVGAHQWRCRTGVPQHAGREVHTHSPVAHLLEFAAEVPGAAGEVGHERRWW